MSSALDGFLDSGLFEPIDIAFAQLLTHMSSTQEEAVALAGAMCSAATRCGQSCVELERIAGTQPRDEQGLPLVTGAFPSAKNWIEALQEARCVSDGQRVAPLVLDSQGRLYLYRMWRAQTDVALRLRELASGLSQDHGEDIEASVERFTPRQWATPMQVKAVRTVATRRLAVITGGPGTGKTTTLARALLLLLERDERLGRRPQRIALLAPTGKAAARMTEALGSVAASLAGCGIPASLLRLLPVRASTVHRALSDAWSSGIIAADVVAVDEASMLDVGLFARLLEAMPRSARLVLIGDENQLASVEAGSLISDIVVAASKSPADADLPSCVVALSQTHRFAQHGAIAALAAAIRQGDADTALGVLGSSGEARLHIVDTLRPESLVVELIAPHLRAYARSNDALARLALLSEVRVLCAHRRGPSSCESVSQAIERALEEKFGLSMPGPWYNGRPVLVRSNDQRLDLSNGEVGVVELTGQRASVVFRCKSGARSLAPTQIRDYETTYAMTVHKAQGSEFEKVLIVLPSQHSRILSRELLYTAVTRAKAQVDIVAPASAIRTACEARVLRASGLAELLAAPAARRKELGE
ncbi:MAG: exodeoxyribonuclease V subunit alpha [Myxococcota bacterium]|jgi:exodeoxyribonuclease V alpha subunit|nr:exodeoxyribonuclease V subunit alpha [Myxococcota bacterium]